MAQYLAPNAQTVGLTPVTIVGFGPGADPDDLCRATVYVFANDHNLGVSYWEFRLLLRHVVGAFASGLISTIVHSNSASAAAWTAVASVNAEGNVQVVVTGALGATVDWLATSDDQICMHGSFGG